MRKDIKELLRRSVERERGARIAVAEIIRCAGREVTQGDIVAEMGRRGVGRVGFRNDLAVVLKHFHKIGMIDMDSEGYPLRDLRYRWTDPDKEVKDYECLIF